MQERPVADLSKHAASRKSIMYYEDVSVRRRETISGLGVDYGYKAAQWRTIWDDPHNSALVLRRKVQERLQVGDVVQIPIAWKLIGTNTAAEARGVGFTADRDGERGTRLNWVQTVYQSNQP